MKRIVGLKSDKDKENVPKPDPVLQVNELVSGLDSKANERETKLAQIDDELKKYLLQMKRMRDGPAKNMVKQKALRLLSQKKRYDHQAELLRQQAFNMEQASFGMQMLKENRDTVSIMKEGAAVMKKELKKINLGEIDNLQDDMGELLETTEEINEALGYSYSMPLVDDDDLQAELEILGEELADDPDTSFLDEVASSSVPVTPRIPEEPSSDLRVPPKAEESTEAIEFYLPRVPQHPL